MNLEDPLSTNYHVPKKSILFCQKAIRISEKSSDKLHDQHHLERILKNTFIFLDENQNLKIDYEILFISICWHDVWKNNFSSNNLVKLFSNYFLDGIGSVFIFIPYTIKYKITIKTVLGATYAILFHPRFNILPILSVEAKILRDLDMLDEFSEERLIEIEKMLLEKKSTSLYFRLLKKYFDIYLKNTKENKYHFEWTKNKFITRRKDFVDKVKLLLANNLS